MLFIAGLSQDHPSAYEWYHKPSEIVGRGWALIAMKQTELGFLHLRCQYSDSGMGPWDCGMIIEVEMTREGKGMYLGITYRLYRVPLGGVCTYRD